MPRQEIGGLIKKLPHNMNYKEIYDRLEVLSGAFHLQEPVETYEDLIATYPNPKAGWAVYVNEDKMIYRYNNYDWEKSVDLSDIQFIIDEANQAISDMGTLESTVNDNEVIRLSNEDTRQSNENIRISAENIREDNEGTRQSNENIRISAENIRKDNEDERITNENKREQNESIREDNEDTRQSNENIRINNELARDEDELIRQANMEIVQGWIANPEQFDGKDLEFTWRGTELGVRLEGDTEYAYVDLKGEAGSIENLTSNHITTALGYDPISPTQLSDKVKTDVPINAKFTDTVTTINGKTGAISKDDIVALGIPSQDTTYSEITTAEIDTGTASTLRTITGRRVKYILDKVQGWIGGLTKSDVGLGNVDNVKQATKVEFDEHKAEKATESEYGHVRLSDLPKGKRVARFVIGTSTAGWTAADCDYLCDGTADDVEINAAITALPATGGEVVILDGTYNITAKVDVTKNNVSIRGNGNATILKRMFNSSVEEGVITLINKSGCKIANLKVEGNRTSYTNSNNSGIYLSSSSNNTVTGNTCYNNSSYGIYLSSASNNNTITGNTCNNNSNNSGIYLDASSNNTVTGNTCNDNNYGINVRSSSNNNTVTDNTCDNNDNSGIGLRSSNNTVTGNTCNDNNYGINLSSASNNNTVTGNISNNNSFGIYLSSSSNNTVTGNTCYNNISGIYLGYSSNNNTVTGNTCIRGTGLTADYSSMQHTIRLDGTNNNYNLIAINNCMGKAVTNGGGTGNTLVNNKFDEA